MVTLKIDDETFAVWNKLAVQRGLTVEEWLKDNMLGTELGDTPAQHHTERPEDWQDRLQAFIAMHEATGTSMDDSRESIYD